MEWVLELWDLQSASVQAAQKISSIVFVFYLFAYYLTKECCFIAAFFIDELISNLSLFDPLLAYQYQLLPVFIYCGLYWHLTINRNKPKVNQLLGCVVIILFNLMVARDAYNNPDVETIIYNNYEYMYVVVHIFLIHTIIDRRLLRRFSSVIISYIGLLVGTNYNMPFIWYTIKNPS